MAVDQNATCPWCGSPLPLATSPKDPSAVPQDGDLSICIKCGGILQFRSVGMDLTLAKMTDANLVELPIETQTEITMFKLAWSTAKNGQ